jgi:hypothetical protein
MENELKRRRRAVSVGQMAMMGLEILPPHHPSQPATTYHDDVKNNPTSFASRKTCDVGFGTGLLDGEGEFTNNVLPKCFSRADAAVDVSDRADAAVALFPPFFLLLVVLATILMRFFLLRFLFMLLLVKFV